MGGAGPPHKPGGVGGVGAQHKPVLADRVVALLAVRAADAAGPSVLVDCTVGAAGHAAALLHASRPVIVAGGGATISGAWDEIQPGSYIFMDADYGRNEWAAPLPRFEHSLFVLTTVMSRPSHGAAIVDAGLKASSVDSGMPRVAEVDGAEYVKASDEHGVLKLGGKARFSVGDKLKLIPGHCDPTVNLYDHYVCVRGGRVEALWPITARGAVW